MGGSSSSPSPPSTSGIFYSSNSLKIISPGSHWCVIPSGVSAIRVEIAAGCGGSGVGTGAPGFGGAINATISIDSGTNVSFNVGEKGSNRGTYGSPGGFGGFNGGGSSGGNYGGGGGGGATDIRFSSTLSSRIVVAGGGGGGGSGGYGGAGGGCQRTANGCPSSDSQSSSNAGTATAGGVTTGTTTRGTLGFGAVGVGSYGGGGGGGYYGGGGGSGSSSSGGGGGGGSSYCSSLCSSVKYYTADSCSDGYANIYFIFSPTATPSGSPSLRPSVVSTLVPSIRPTTQAPSNVPSLSPTVAPSVAPTVIPIRPPSVNPTTYSPSNKPSAKPSVEPTGAPSFPLTVSPSSLVPNAIPSQNPSRDPSTWPTVLTTTAIPSLVPSVVVTRTPSVGPSVEPTLFPTFPRTLPPTSYVPSIYPSTSTPSTGPTVFPSVLQTSLPSNVQTTCPSRNPSVEATAESTFSPSYPRTVSPSTAVPSNVRSTGPSVEYTFVPSISFTVSPSSACMISGRPSCSPSVVPSLMTALPSVQSSQIQTNAPVTSGGIAPSLRPNSLVPTNNLPPPSTQPRSPSLFPNNLPPIAPSVVEPSSSFPTYAPSFQPYSTPSLNPSFLPSTSSPSVATSIVPSVTHTIQPTVRNPTSSSSLQPFTASCTNSQNSQCGGANYAGSTCCPTGTCCTFVDYYTFECRSSSTACPCTDSSIVRSLNQCAGAQYAGPTCCPVGSCCTYHDYWFSECKPSIGTCSPTYAPSPSPSLLPSTSTVPSFELSPKPSESPSVASSEYPSTSPTNGPSVQPNIIATISPSQQSSSIPSILGLTELPTQFPTTVQTINPSLEPTITTTLMSTLPPSESKLHTFIPSSVATEPLTDLSNPTSTVPTIMPTSFPISNPTSIPNPLPTVTELPTSSGSSNPTTVPISMSTSSPTTDPTAAATTTPTHVQSAQPSFVSTIEPTFPPLISTCQPTQVTFSSPSTDPSSAFTKHPTFWPSSQLSTSTAIPNTVPSVTPILSLPVTNGPSTSTSTDIPSRDPTTVASVAPTITPTLLPLSQYLIPTTDPLPAATINPTCVPSTSTAMPTKDPSSSPSTNINAPTKPPLNSPSFAPAVSLSPVQTLVPTGMHTTLPISSSPTVGPSTVPTISPIAALSSIRPSSIHTGLPSSVHSIMPTGTLSAGPTLISTNSPKRTPTIEPTIVPTFLPSVAPSSQLTSTPSYCPTVEGSGTPSCEPTIFPSRYPSSAPSIRSSFLPSLKPSEMPSVSTSMSPSLLPLRTAVPSAMPSFARISLAPFLAMSSDSIRISSLVSTNHFNVQNNLLLEASIRSSISCISNWTTSDPTFVLSTAAIVSGSQLVLPSKVSTVQLYLTANALSSHRSYQFTVHCGRLQSTIVVITNAPPSHGIFNVYPHIGIETRTQFLLLASLWIDDNLPLSYQFGFCDPTTVKIFILQDKSVRNITKSTLPAGLSTADYFINSTMEVFDLFSASVSRSATVQNTPSNSFILASFVNSHLSRTLSSASIVLISNIMNKVNCSGAVNCGEYNRLPCATVDHTCGECMSGFVGSGGPQNSRCFKSVSAIISSTRKCSDDADCDTFQECNTTTKSCFVPLQKCPNSCSSQGICTFVDTNTGLAITECKMTSSDCRAVCKCSEGFAGASCQLTVAQLAQRQSQRNQLLQSFNSMLFRNTSSATIISQSSTLLSLTQKSDELGAIAVTEALTAANTLLQNAVQAQVNYRDLTTILKSLDSVASASAAHNSSHTSHLLDALSTYGSATEAQIVGDQVAVDIFSKFRVCTVGLSKSGSNLSVPQSPLEALQSSISSYVHFAQNESNTVRLKVTIIETSASLLGSSNPYISNPLIVQISNLNGLNSSTMGREVLVALKRVASIPTLPLYNFSTICRKPKIMSQTIFNYTCPLTGHVLSHNCSNKLGKLVSYCPVYKPSCQSLPGVPSLSKSMCHMVNYTETLTWCLCIILPVSNKRRNLLSSSVAAGLQDSGALQLVAMSKLVSSDFMNTFSAAPSLTDPSNIEKALIVIIMFATLWSAGFGLLVMCNWRRHLKKKANEKDDKFLERRKRGAGVAQSPAAVQEYLSNYILEVFPAVFQKKSRFQQIVEEVRNHHRYISLFLSEESGPRADHARVLKVIQILSIQSLLMFLLALLYDLQSPADDGSCDYLVTEATCLSRTSPLDTSQTFCYWAPATDDSVHTMDGYTCSYQDPVITFRMVLFVAMIVSICTAIFLRPMEYLFDVLNSPTADTKKLAAERANIETKIIDATRRVSVAVTGAARKAASTLSSSRGVQKKVMVGVETRIVPGSTAVAQELARASASIIAPIANHMIRKQHFESFVLKHRLRASRELANEDSVSNDSVESNYDSIDDNESGNSGSPRNNSDRISDLRPQEDKERNAAISTIGVNALVSRNKYLTLTTDELLHELTEDISMQRKFLQTSELEEFDKQWGIDPTGEFTRVEHMGYCIMTMVETKEIISHEIDVVKKFSLEKIEKLKIASDEHAGLEIIHLFILDLLGRDTPAARIFEQKSEEDFKRTQVVSGFGKTVAAVVLLVMNIFFAYYSVLYGFTNGIAWQRTYLSACVAQLFVEVFINETLEVVWMNFFVPTLVAEEVQAVSTSLLDIVQNLCTISATSEFNNVQNGNKNVVNAAEYLFVSFNVAKCYPSLMESFLVQAFTSHLPGELSKKWHFGPTTSRTNGRRGFSLLRLNVAFSIAFAWLKYFAMAPSLLQRMFIRSAQPFLVTGIIMAYTVVIESPVFIALFVVGVVVLSAYFVYCYFQGVNYSHSLLSNQVVHPLLSPDFDEKEEIIEIDTTANDNHRSNNSRSSSFEDDISNDEEEDDDDMDMNGVCSGNDSLRRELNDNLDSSSIQLDIHFHQGVVISSDGSSSWANLSDDGSEFE